MAARSRSAGETAKHVIAIVAIACTATVVGCGSESTGRTSADAVYRTTREFGGPDVKVYASKVQVKSADDGQWREMTVITACKPEGGCTIVAPDGVSYRDVQHFVDDNKAIKPGDTVLANPNMASPDAPARLEEFTKSARPHWAWYAGGGALLLTLLLVAIWMIRKRHRRTEEQTLLEAGETPRNEE